MIHGIGIDIVHIPKFKRVIERWGERFKRRVFTEGELLYCETRRSFEQHLAARFAAKEAFLKAMGKGIRFTDIEIMNSPNGKPYVVLKNKGKGQMAKGKIKTPDQNPDHTSEVRNFNIHLSLSHDRDYCIAQVLLETN